MKIDARFEHQLLAVETEHQVHCMLELTAPPAPAGRTRPTLHLALVIDRSGSMAGRKLEVARRCAGFLARRLAPTDELALVAYDDEVTLVSPLAPVDQRTLLAAIGLIRPGGQTNLSGGWLKGVEELGRASGEGARKVLLLTDGLANVGITDRASLVQMTANAAQATEVGTTTIGFGDDFDEELLLRMADAGRGNAHYAPTPEAAPGIFAKEFEDLVSLVAQNVSVEIRPSEEVRLLGILNEFPVVAVSGGVQIQLGDAFADEHRRLVFRLHVPSLASLGPARLAEVVLRYTSVGEQIAQHEVTLPLVVNLVSADEAAANGPDAEVVEEIVILRAARAQEQAREHADAGQFDQARKVLDEASTELRRIAPGSARTQELLRQAEMLEDNATSMEPAMYDIRARKQMMFQTRETRQRRQR